MWVARNSGMTGPHRPCIDHSVSWLLLFLSTGRVLGSTQVHVAFPLSFHSQGQRWPAGNSTFVCAMKGSSQRPAFTRIISFDSPQLPLGKMGVIVPTLQMRELRFRGTRRGPKIIGLARGPEFLSPSPMPLHVTRAWALLRLKPSCVLRKLFAPSRRAVRCR